MSLEVKIEALTKAVELLTAALSAQAAIAQQPVTPAVVVTEPVKVTAPEKKARPKVSDVKVSDAELFKSHDELQTMLLMKVRDNLDNRPKIADILATHSAKKIGDLSTEQVQAVFPQIEAL